MAGYAWMDVAGRLELSPPALGSMALIVTQCPSCESTFNISGRLLQAAGGLVRCGACLTVFAAAENQVERTDAADSTPEDIFVSPPEGYFDAVRFVRTASGLRAVDPDAPDTTPEPALADDAPALEDTTEITWVVHRDPAWEPGPAEQLSPFNETGPAVQPEPLVEPEASMDAEPPTMPPVSEPVPEPEVMAATITAGDAALEPGVEAIPAPAADPDLTAADTQADPTPTPVSESTADKDRLRAQLNATRLEVDEPPVPPGVLADLTWEPEATVLELSAPIRRSPWRTVTLAAVSLLLLVTLGLQFLWRHRDTLALTPALRPSYAWVCGWLGCILPPQEALSLIRMDALVVQSHPEVPGALIVSAVLRNDAPFPQPFPVTRMTFSSPGGQPVAARNFLPADYLPPSLRTVNPMPPGTPVQIRLDLVDPGPDAVNYALEFITRYR